MKWIFSRISSWIGSWLGSWIYFKSLVWWNEYTRESKHTIDKKTDNGIEKTR